MARELSAKTATKIVRRLLVAIAVADTINAAFSIYRAVRAVRK